MKSTRFERTPAVSAERLFEHCDKSLERTALLIGCSSSTVSKAMSSGMISAKFENAAKAALEREVLKKSIAPTVPIRPFNLLTGTTTKPSIEPSQPKAPADCSKVVLLRIPQSKLEAFNKVAKILDAEFEELV